MPNVAPNPYLLRALGRLLRGLSALFRGLPVSLVVCVKSARGDWLRPLGILPALAVTGLLVHGLWLLSDFQKQERIWTLALDRAKLLAIVNVGLAPFLYWWGRLPAEPLYLAMVEMMIFTGLLFLYVLNPVLWRLAAMLPDETLRLETKLFTTINRYLLVATLLLVAGYFTLLHMHGLPHTLMDFLVVLDKLSIWLGLFLVLLPVAMTMALIWKIKEVILASVFEPGQ